MDLARLQGNAVARAYSLQNALDIPLISHLSTTNLELQPGAPAPIRTALHRMLPPVSRTQHGDNSLLQFIPEFVKPAQRPTENGSAVNMVRIMDDDGRAVATSIR